MFALGQSVVRIWSLICSSLVFHSKKRLAYRVDARLCVRDDLPLADVTGVLFRIVSSFEGCAPGPDDTATPTIEKREETLRFRGLELTLA